MPSPFPGVDPYLEEAALWEDVHARLANAISDQIQPQLAPRYFAALTPYVTYDNIMIAEAESIKPDIAVLERRPARFAETTATATLAVPFTGLAVIEQPEPPSKAQRIEVRAVGNNMLVTAIELLSPSNKRPGTDTHDAYLRKRRDLLKSDVHFIEIDLLRRGVRWMLQTPLPDAPYFVFLSRADARPRVDIWPLTVREPPSAFPVPLRAPDADVVVDLGAALAQTYARGAYDLRVDYRRDPPPPAFAPAEAAWLDARLHAAGRR